MERRKSIPYIWSVSEENEIDNGATKLLEEVIAENFPELRKDTKP